MSGGDDMTGEAEEIYRWASLRERAFQNAIPALERARKKMDLIRGLARKMKIEAAIELKAKAESEIWQALGSMLDPTKSNAEKVELAQRAFLHDNQKGALVVGGIGCKAYTQDLRMARDKIDALASAVAKSRGLMVNSADVLASMAEKGWTNEKLADAWSGFLTEVIGPQSRATINQKREALRDYIEWVRSQEPKAVIEMGTDLDTMSEDQLREFQSRVAGVLVDAVIEKEQE